MKHLIAAVGLAFSLASPALADPYCPDLLIPEALPKKAARIAPLYSSSTTGWIFGSDQFKGGFALSAASQSLMAQIREELAERGTRLALLVAPPRPLVAGSDVVAQTLGQAPVDMALLAADFTALHDQLNALGIPSPNLLERAGAGYYFQRDTHWTNQGAAVSAAALATSLGLVPGFDPATLPIREQGQEPGSLSDLVREVCNQSPAVETTPLFDYAALAGNDLLGETTRASGALVGSSFSDRYRRDAYQVADALALALEMDISNHSISGGGLVGPLEAYILSGRLAAEQPELLIWEFPYTYTLKEAALRQILGALRADPWLNSHSLALEEGKGTVQVWPNDASLLGLELADPKVREIKIKVRRATGDPLDLKLVRKSRVLDATDLDTWWLDLSGLDAITRLEVAVRGAEPAALTLRF